VKGNLLWELLGVFAPLSLLAIGGGQSILGDLQRQTVTVHHWLGQGQFLDDFAIARAAPGPNTLIVTLIGWQVAGAAGAAVASLAIFLPSAILFYGLAHIWRSAAFARWRGPLTRGLAPISVGLVLASTWSVLLHSGGGSRGWIVAGASCLALLATRVHPFILLFGGAAAFLLTHG
jgi:chromate transporter